MKNIEMWRLAVAEVRYQSDRMAHDGLDDQRLEQLHQRNNGILWVLVQDVADGFIPDCDAIDELRADIATHPYVGYTRYPEVATLMIRRRAITRAKHRRVELEGIER